MLDFRDFREFVIGCTLLIKINIILIVIIQNFFVNLVINKVMVYISRKNSQYFVSCSKYFFLFLNIVNNNLKIIID